MTVNFVLISGMLGFLGVIFFVFIKEKKGVLLSRGREIRVSEFEFEISSNIGKINITR